jgi:hypothetical protein
MPAEFARCLLSLNITSDSDDAERLDLTRRLSSEIQRSVDVEQIEFENAALPPGSKGIAFDVQTVLVTLAALGGVPHYSDSVHSAMAFAKRGGQRYSRNQWGQTYSDWSLFRVRTTFGESLDQSSSIVGGHLQRGEARGVQGP